MLYNGKRPLSSLLSSGNEDITAKRLRVGDKYEFPPSAPPGPGHVMTSGSDPSEPLEWVPSGGGGGVTDHTQLTSIGVSTHADLDAFKADTESKLGQALNIGSDVSFNSVRTPLLQTTDDLNIVSQTASVNIVSNGTAGLHDINLTTGRNINLTCGNGDDIVLTGGYIGLRTGDVSVEGPIRVAEQASFANEVIIGDTRATQYTLPQSRGTVGQTIRQNEAGLTSWVDPTPPPANSYGNYFMAGNSLQTAVAVPGLFTPIVGIMQSSERAGFAFAPNVLQYTAADTGRFLITASVSWELTGGAGDDCAIAIGKNSAVVQGSLQRTRLDDNNNFPRNCTTSAIVELSTGDQVDARICNFEDTTPLLVTDLSFTVVQISVQPNGAVFALPNEVTILRNSPAAIPIFADGAPAIGPNWSFVNTQAGAKINWYFFGQTAEQTLTVGDIDSVYALCTINNMVDQQSLPWIGLYTKATGEGDASWYKARRNFAVPATAGITSGEQVLLYVGADPADKHPDVRHIQLAVDGISNDGDIGIEQQIFLMPFATDSSAAVGNVDLTLVEFAVRIGSNYNILTLS